MPDSGSKEEEDVTRVELRMGFFASWRFGVEQHAVLDFASVGWASEGTLALPQEPRVVTYNPAPELAETLVALFESEAAPLEFDARMRDFPIPKGGFWGGVLYRPPCFEAVEYSVGSTQSGSVILRLLPPDPKMTKWRRIGIFNTDTYEITDHERLDAILRPYRDLTLGLLGPPDVQEPCFQDSPASHD
jgi:hypothetical protein